MSNQLSVESQSQYVQANDLTVYYEESGSGQPLILLHGGTATLQMWQSYIPALAKHFRVIAMDSRGHGRTNNPASEMSYRGMADDVVAFAKALGLEKPLIFGWSDGGQVALELGMRYGDFAGALVVGGAFYKFTESYFAALASWGMVRPEELDFGQMEQHAGDYVAYLQEAHPRPDDPTYWKTLIQQIAVMWYTPLEYTEKEFKQIVVPTLILNGDRDDLIALDQAVDMYRMIPGAELAVIPNASHGTTLEHVSVMPTILDFFKRHSEPESQDSR